MNLERNNVRSGGHLFNDQTQVLANSDRRKVEAVVIKGDCEDIFGNKVFINDCAKINELVGNDEETFYKNEDERLRNELENISNSIDSVFDDLNLSEVETYVQMENSQKVINCLDELGPLSYEELARQIGVNDRDLFQTLVWLDSVDTVNHEEDDVRDISGDTQLKLNTDI